MLMHSEPIKARPNILLILTDQQRHDAVGYINQTLITPNLNRLAAESIICTKAFVQSPQCQPSRASILTGRYPTAHKVWWNETVLNQAELMIGNYLRAAGYETAYFGKFHVSGQAPAGELARHFGFNKCFLSEDWQSLILPGSPGRARIQREFYAPMTKPTWTGQMTDRSLHHDEVITSQALEWMRTTRRPFFAIVSYHGPHPPYAAPKEFSDLYEASTIPIPDIMLPNLNGYLMTPDDWRALKVQYYGNVSWIDHNVGKLLTAMTLNDIVAYLSDHGDILGDHGLFSKGLFTYDGNTRIPLLLRLPGIGHMRYDNLIEAIDILPTILESIKVGVDRRIQGLSFVDCFRANRPGRNSVISMIGHFPRLRMLRTDAVKYWIYGDEEHLYDLRADPNEERNITGNAALLHEMRFQLLRALIRCEDPMPYPS